MRRHLRSSSVSPAILARNDWSTLKTFLPYVWVYKWRVMLAMFLLVSAKLASMGVPLVLKELVDSMAPAGSGAKAMLAVPVGLLVAYGVLRLASTLLTELRELVFSRVTQSAVRSVALSVFRHLHSLSLRFHLDRQTGGMTRDIERGTRSIMSLIMFTLFNILPTAVEIILVLGYLLLKYDIWFSVIAFTALVLYFGYTITVTNWRTHFRRTMNELDSNAHAKAVDSLINYETVKYFGNENHEARNYDEGLRSYEAAAIKSQLALSVLNTGQAVIIAATVSVSCGMRRRASSMAA